ncbi:MAG: AI-2E family transporter [Alistipes sp.]|nr:AI-2E family transporter [Alistipes sp.]
MNIRDFREKYWRYSLIVLILVLGTVLAAELTLFLGGVLGALTIYILLRGQMRRLAARGWRRSLAATLLLVEAVVLFLIPVSLMVWMFVDRIQDFAADPQAVVGPLKQLAELIRQRTGYDVLHGDNLSSLVAFSTRFAQSVVGGIMNFGINLVVLLFMLYFMLIGGPRMEEYLRRLLPFSEPVSRQVVHEIRTIVRSNAIGVPVLALAQGIVAYVGYLIFGAPEALLWGVVSCIATIIPVVGTMLVWVPLAAYLALTGHWGAAIGLGLYGTLVIAQADNVVRMLLQRRMADTHPLVTVFGVAAGLPLFGFMGVIFGPLMLAMLLFCIDLFKRCYVDGTPNETLLAAEARGSRG